MAVPTTRSEFKEYCLRKLGKPVINIDVHDDQVEDRIDEAIDLFQQYHYDGSEKVYYAHQITSTDISNRYITTPESLRDIFNVYGVGASFLEGTGMFNINYQFALNYNHQVGKLDLTSIFLRGQYISLMDQVIGSTPRIRFSRHSDKLYIDTEWGNLAEGNYIVAEGYQVLDPDTFTDIWSDRWLQNYCAALIKKNWGDNISKFEGIQMAGGVALNGLKIQDDAENDIQNLEDQLMNKYSLPPEDMYG